MGCRTISKSSRAVNSADGGHFGAEGRRADLGPPPGLRGSGSLELDEEAGEGDDPILRHRISQTAHRMVESRPKMVPAETGWRFTKGLNWAESQIFIYRRSALIALPPSPAKIEPVTSLHPTQTGLSDFKQFRRVALYPLGNTRSATVLGTFETRFPKIHIKSTRSSPDSQIMPS